MSEELNVVGYLHKNSVGVRILSREATIMARDEGEGWTSTALVPADELSTLRAQNAALVEALRKCRNAVGHGSLEPRRTVREIVDGAIKEEARNALAQVAI